jgi:hypothetical protein
MHLTHSIVARFAQNDVNERKTNDISKGSRRCTRRKATEHNSWSIGKGIDDKTSTRNYLRKTLRNVGVAIQSLVRGNNFDARYMIFVLTIVTRKDTAVIFTVPDA